MSSSSGASRPWSAPASPRWTATSSSTGSEPLGGVDELVDEVRRASFNASPLGWRPLEGPLEGPPAKRLRPITLPDQREPPPLVAPALLALSSAASILTLASACSRSGAGGERRARAAAPCAPPATPATDAAGHARPARLFAGLESRTRLERLASIGGEAGRARAYAA